MAWEYNQFDKLEFGKERFSVNDIEIGLQMYQKATDFVNKRFPSGWGGCAVIFTEDQQYLISVA